MNKTIARFLRSGMWLGLCPSLLLAEPLTEEAEVLVQQALRLRAENRFKEAQVKLQTLLQQQPRHPLGLLAMTELTFHLGQFENCVATGQKAIEENPNNADLCLYVGSALMYLGRDLDAEVVLKKGTGLSPNRSDFWLELGNLELARENYPLAQNHFEKALSLDPELVLAAYGMALVLRAQNYLEEARHWLQKATQWDPTFFQAHFQLGVMDWEAGHRAEAEAQFKKVLESAQVHPETFLYLALIEEKKARQLRQYQWLSRALPYFSRQGGHQVEEKMHTLETTWGFSREVMQALAQWDLPVDLGESEEEVTQHMGLPPARSSDGKTWLYSMQGVSLRFDAGHVQRIEVDVAYEGKVHGLRVGESAEEVEKRYGLAHRAQGQHWSYQFHTQQMTLELKNGIIQRFVVEVL